jgi:hypothetical protein
MNDRRPSDLSSRFPPKDRDERVLCTTNRSFLSSNNHLLAFCHNIYFMSSPSKKAKIENMSKFEGKTMKSVMALKNVAPK